MDAVVTKSLLFIWSSCKSKLCQRINIGVIGVSSGLTFSMLLPNSLATNFRLANPTNFTKMGLWTIAKANDSKDMSKQNPLVGILQKELSITPPQIRKILDQRQKIRALCSNLNATLGLILQLKELCEQKNKKFNDRMTKTREILTPKQVVKLIMWIKRHSDVLGNICPGWTSEQIVKRKALAPKADSDAKGLENGATSSEAKVPGATPEATASPDPSADGNNE